MTVRRLNILTPEMVPLDFEVASPGARAAAFLVDVTFIVVGLVVFTLAIIMGAAMVPESRSLAIALVLLLFFAVRSFYFIAFELRWRGQTPGKRLLKLRVLAADGGPLTPDMVFARNLTREVEVFLPLLAICLPQTIVPGSPLAVRLATGTWAALLALLPLLNRGHARLGDLVAGTVVVVQPRAALLEDLVASDDAGGSGPQARFVFTKEQLDLYGIYELQVLEEVLRRQPAPADDALLDAICAKIIRKIGWPQDPLQVPSEPFLRAFYAAQRARLEHQMLMGDRRERKRA